MIIQNAILNENVTQLKELVTTSGLLQKAPYFHNNNNNNSFFPTPFSFTPLEAAIYFNKLVSAEFLITQGAKLSSQFMALHYEAKKSTGKIKKLLANQTYETSGQKPHTGTYTPGGIKQLLEHNFNLLNNPSFIKNAVQSCNGDDLALLIRVGADFSDNIVELFAEGIKEPNNYWEEKLSLLANINICDADTHANLLYRILSENFNPSPFLSANINWFYQLPDILRNENIIEKSNSTGLKFIFLFDYFLTLNPNLARQIPRSRFNINIMDSEGLSFLHKVIHGRYTNNPNAQNNLAQILMHSFGINPLLRTPHPENMTAYQIAYKMRRFDLVQMISKYTDDYLLMHPSQKETIAAQTSELFTIQQQKSDEIAKKQIIDLLKQLNNKLDKVNERVEMLETKVLKLEMEVDIMSTIPLAESSLQKIKPTETIILDNTFIEMPTLLPRCEN